MAEYLDHRKEKLAQIARVLFHKLPKAAGAGGEGANDCPGLWGWFRNWTSKVLQDIPLASDEGERGKVAAWLYGFETAARLYHVAVFELLPQKAKDWHMEQGRSTASGAFALRPPQEVADGEDGGGSGQSLQRPPARRHPRARP